MNDIFIKAQQQLQPFLDMTGYEPKTTFWTDFSIADGFGEKAIKDTYKRAFNEWKTDRVYITELVLVLNWKIWQYAESNPLLAMVYQKLWEDADGWCMKNLKDEDLKYFLKTTD